MPRDPIALNQLMGLANQTAGEEEGMLSMLGLIDLLHDLN